MKLASLPGYLRSALQFAHTGSGWPDYPGAALLGLARRAPFDGTTPLTLIARRLFPQINVHPKRLAGLPVEVDTSDLGQLICYEEVLRENVYDLDLLAFEPEAILDCGAHVGLFSMLALARFPRARLVAFEPNPENAAHLRRHLQPCLDRVQIHEAAVALQDGESWFEKGESNTGRLGEGSGEKGWRVRMENLPQWIAQMRCRSMLLKLDVEGEEVRLAPEIAPHLPPRCAIFFETHDGQAAWDKVDAALRIHGFEVKCIRNRDIYREGFACRS